ncbi:cytochrome C biogenesis protein [Candidatus Micrarchaeota archaeon]|nr:cytochrome C biogenesis protein [Candidatus Micrarchaeota archaeon]
MVEQATILFSFVAGLVSFLSPCILPLVPAYLTFLANSSINEASSSASSKTKVFLSSVFFVLGFSVVFAVLGVLLQSVLSTVAYDVRTYLSYLGGIVIIFFGILLTGIIEIPVLSSEKKIHVSKSSNAYLGSFLFGAAFAAGWTPCVGAVLGSILTLAITNPTSAFPLMLSYSLGLGVPFLLVGIFISQATFLIKKLSPYLKWLNLLFGLVLIILGILVFTGNILYLSNLFPVSDYLLS